MRGCASPMARGLLHNPYGEDGLSLATRRNVCESSKKSHLKEVSQNANIQNAPSDDGHGGTRRGRRCRRYRRRLSRAIELDGDDARARGTEQNDAAWAEIGDASEIGHVQDPLPEHGLRLKLRVELRLECRIGLLGACTGRDLPVIGHTG